MTVSILAVDSTDDWTTAEVDFDDGGGAQTFTPSGDVHNALEWLTEFIDWFDSTFGEIPSWSQATDGAGGGVLTFTTIGSYSATATAAAQSLVGLSAVYGSGSTFAAAGAAASTLSPALPLSWGAYRRGLTWEAARSGAGTTGGDALGAGVRRPILAGAGSPAEAFRLAEIARAARHPRLVTVYDGSTFIEASVGQITRNRTRPGVHRLALEVLA